MTGLLLGFCLGVTVIILIDWDDSMGPHDSRWWHKWRYNPMSRISEWIDKLQENAFINTIRKIFKTFLGQAGETLWETTREEVNKADELDETGAKKYEIVYKKVKDKISLVILPDYAEQFLKVAIELAVIWLKEWIRRKV